MENKKLTLEYLINRAGEETKKEKQREIYIEIYIERLDKTITVKSPDNTLILDATEINQESKLESDYYLIYNSIVSPNLKDKGLQDAYGVKKPTEILDKIFNIGEIINIGKILLEMAGYKETSVKLVDNLKN